MNFRSLVGNTVAVGGPTNKNKSGCLPSSGKLEQADRGDGQINTTGTVVQERAERDCSTSRPHLDRVPNPRHSSGPFANGERTMYDLYESTLRTGKNRYCVKSIN